MSLSATRPTVNLCEALGMQTHTRGASVLSVRGTEGPPPPHTSKHKMKTDSKKTENVQLMTAH